MLLFAYIYSGKPFSVKFQYFVYQHQKNSSYNQISSDIAYLVQQCFLHDKCLFQCRLRGKIDSNGVVSAFLEERLNMGLNFLLSAEVRTIKQPSLLDLYIIKQVSNASRAYNLQIDHKKKDYKFGFGLTVGEQTRNRFFIIESRIEADKLQGELVGGGEIPLLLLKLESVLYAEINLIQLFVSRCEICQQMFFCRFAIFFFIRDNLFLFHYILMNMSSCSFHMKTCYVVFTNKLSYLIKLCIMLC